MVCLFVFSKGNVLTHETEKFKVSTRLIKPGPRGLNSYLQNSIFLHLRSASHGGVKRYVLTAGKVRFTSFLLLSTREDINVVLVLPS